MNGRKALSLFLKLIVIISAVTGTVMSTLAGGRSFMGGIHTMMFFTIQSNIAIAIICLVELIMAYARRTNGRKLNVVKYVGTVSITLTGVVFCGVLAPTMGVYAWSIPNILTHVIVPVAAVLDLFVTCVGEDLRNKDTVYVILPPLAYAIYAGIGYVCGWQFGEGINYPYFFLNWGSPAGAFGFSKDLPYMGCVWWILALLLFLIAVGRLYLFILRRLDHPGK